MKSLPLARSDAKHSLKGTFNPMSRQVFQIISRWLHIGLSTQLTFYLNQSPKQLFILRL